LIIFVKYREASDSGRANGRVLISVILEVVDDLNKVVYARDNSISMEMSWNAYRMKGC